MVQRGPLSFIVLNGYAVQTLAAGVLKGSLYEVRIPSPLSPIRSWSKVAPQPIPQLEQGLFGILLARAARAFLKCYVVGETANGFHVN